MPVQVRNADGTGLAGTDLQARYEPNFAWACAGAYQQLMGLRGWWSMGAVNDVPEAVDGSGQGRHLSQTGDVQFRSWDLAPYVYLNGNKWLYRLDEAGLDTLGSDWFHLADNGMAAGGWVYFTRAAGNLEVIAGKWGAAGNRSWLLTRDVAGTITYTAVDAGGASTATSTTVTAANRWYFVAGRLRRAAADPNPGLDVFVDRDGISTPIAMGALINSNANFTIGATAAGANSMQGYVSNAFLCAAAINNLQMASLYEMTRALYSA